MVPCRAGSTSRRATDGAAPPLAVCAGAWGGCATAHRLRDRVPAGAFLQRLVGLPVDVARQRNRHVRTVAPEWESARVEGAARLAGDHGSAASGGAAHG